MGVRVLAIADEESDALWGDTLLDLRPDLIVSCGDLPFEYLENLVSRTDKPLLYVPGNHDPDVRPRNDVFADLRYTDDVGGPPGCENVDGRIATAGGLRIAGLGGSIRYREGPNQYSQREMAWRALRLRARAWASRRPVDILVTHSPPAGYGDSDDPPHHGFVSLVGLAQRLSPQLLIHGHVNNYGPAGGEVRIGRTRVVNAIPFKLIEV